MGLLRSGLFRSLAAASLVLFGQSALAQSGVDYYNGKTVTYIVSTAPGGAYDTYGRLITQYMQKYLPGSTFVVKNVPGGGHMIGANTIYSSEPDGLTIGTFNTGLIYSQILENPGVKFDLSKMSWVGKAGADARVLVVAEQSPIKTLDDLINSKREVLFCAGGVGAAQYVDSKMLIDALHLPAKLLTGYVGNDDQLAMRRGEIEATVSSRTSFQDFVGSGYGRIIAQIGGTDGDAPQLKDLVKDPSVLPMIALINSQGEISRLTAGPPGIPEDRLAALREAYDKALADPELREKAAQIGLPLDPANGETVEKMIVEALQQPPESVEFLRSAVAEK